MTITQLRDRIARLQADKRRAQHDHNHTELERINTELDEAFATWKAMWAHGTTGSP